VDELDGTGARWNEVEGEGPGTGYGVKEGFVRTSTVDEEDRGEVYSPAASAIRNVQHGLH
jgi:hypothetical protein